MNAFYEHHRDSIRWHYRCFDRILLNGLIQPFQQPERVVGFFNTYRRLYPVSRQLLHGIADHFQKWLKGWTENAKVPVLDALKGRRDEFVEPYFYFRCAKPDAIVVVLKSREPARIMIAIGDKTADRWHLELGLCAKVGDGANREGGIWWGCLTTSLLHRRSDMPCRMIPLSS
jgi:hypothetical protein